MVTHRMIEGRLKIVRNEETINLIRELSLYHYDETKHTEDPIKEDDHTCDALRYLVVGLDRIGYVASVMTEETKEEQEAKEKTEKAATLAEQTKRQEAALADEDRWY